MTPLPGGPWGAPDRTARQRGRPAAGHDGVAEMAFGPLATTPIDYVEQDWLNEPFTAGVQAALPPGLMTEVGSAAVEPVGPLHWSSTEARHSLDGMDERGGGIGGAGRRRGSSVLRIMNAEERAEALAFTFDLLYNSANTKIRSTTRGAIMKVRTGRRLLTRTALGSDAAARQRAAVMTTQRRRRRRRVRTGSASTVASVDRRDQRRPTPRRQAAR